MRTKKELRKWLLENAFTKNGMKVRCKIWQNHFFDEQKAVKYYTYFFPDDTRLSTRILAFLNGQTELAKCVICGSVMQPNSRGKQKQFCSNKCVNNHEPCRIKFRKTMQEKYGGEYSGNSPLIQDKTRETNLERYGVEWAVASEPTRNKIKKSFDERYGGHPMRSHAVRERVKKTNLERYGVKWAIASEEVQKKIQESIMANEAKLSRDIYSKLNDPLFMTDCYSNRGLSSEEMAVQLGVSKVTVLRYLHKHHIELRVSSNMSYMEVTISSYLSKYGDIVSSARNIISPYELDIYLPEYRLAIEYNGAYWHSLKDKFYHLNKTILCREKNIQLFHIFEDDDIKLWYDRVEDFINGVIHPTISEYQGHQYIIADNTWEYYDLPVIDIIEPQIIRRCNYDLWDCGYTIYEVNR